MAQKSLAEQLPVTARTEVGEFISRLLAVLESRFQAIERDITKEERTIEVVRQVAIERINSTITPIVENALEDLHSLGGMFTASIPGTYTVKVGNFQVFVVDEKERHTFAALDWVAIRANDDNTVSMSGPIRYYSPDTGEMVVDVTNVTGSGTYTGWKAHVSVPYDPAVQAQLYVSPQLTGNPTAPTAGLGDNDSTIATTAFVQNALADMAETLPETLEALDRLAESLGNDPNFAVSTAQALEQRLRVDINNQNLTATQKGNGQTNLDVYSKAGVQAWSLGIHHTKAEIAGFGYTTTAYVNATFATIAFSNATYYTIASANNLYTTLVNLINGRVDWATYNAFVANAGNYSTYAWVNQRIADDNVTDQNWTITYFTQPYQVNTQIDAKVNANNSNWIVPNFYYKWQTYSQGEVESRAQAHGAAQGEAAASRWYYNVVSPNMATYSWVQGNYASIAAHNNSVYYLGWTGYGEYGVAGNAWTNVPANAAMQGVYLYIHPYYGPYVITISFRYLARWTPNSGWLTVGAND
jgi:hypothetical protein